MGTITRLLRYGALAMLAAALLTACVDDTYNLNNVESSDITLGDTITTPPIKAELSLEGLLGGMSEVEKILEENGFTMDDIGFVEMFIGHELFLTEIPFDSPVIPNEILDMLNDGQSLELLLSVRSTLPMAVQMRLEFMDAAGNTILSFDGIEIPATAEGDIFTQEQRQDISPLLDRMHEIQSMKMTLLRPDLNKIKFLLDNYIYIEARIEKTGGIKL